MKVWELIEKLQELDPDQQIRFVDCEHGPLDIDSIIGNDEEGYMIQ